MPISAQCPNCNASVSIGDQAAGKRVRCPHCQKQFLAPGVTGSQNDDDDWLQLDEPTATTPVRSAPEPTTTQTIGSQATAGQDSLFDDLPPELAVEELGGDDLGGSSTDDHAG